MKINHEFNIWRIFNNIRYSLLKKTISNDLLNKLLKYLVVKITKGIKYPKECNSTKND